MYQKLKRLTLSVVPKKFLLRHEVFFRSIYSIRLHGKKFGCALCGHTLKKFIPLPDHDLLCPFCGSRSRTRRLFTFLNENNLVKGAVLHFSPSRSLYRNLKNNPDISYSSTDYEDEFIAEYNYDITNIPVAEQTFDLIICYHILEHIEKDEQAMRELRRVLKPKGICIFQTPFKEGEIYEDHTLKNPAERLSAFGQADHVRIYSISGLCGRLSKNGFGDVQIQTFKNNEYWGLLPQTIIVARP